MSHPWMIVGVGDDWRAENLITGERGPRRKLIAIASADVDYLGAGGEPDGLVGMDAETYAELQSIEEDAAEPTTTVEQDLIDYGRCLAAIGGGPGIPIFL